MSLRHVLFPEPRKEWTRQEQIAWAREWHAKRRAEYDAAQPGPERQRLFHSVCAARRELTRKIVFLRVEQREPLAVFRYRWIYDAIQCRARLQKAMEHHAWRERAVAGDRERLSRGTRPDGRPYAKATLQTFRRSLQDHDAYLVAAEADLQAFFATVPPRYHVWRRQQEIAEAHPLRPPRKAPSRAAGNVVSLVDEARRRRRGEG
jgi:hypothetical protein